jgi:hypothetical protein
MSEIKNIFDENLSSIQSSMGEETLIQINSMHKW